jgi:hypothetical protein
LGGPWCLTTISREDHTELLDKIRSWESMTVVELFNADSTVGKDYNIADLPNLQAASG